MDQRSKSKSFHYFIIAICIVFTLWLLSWAFTSFVIGPDEKGVFGDSFGALNALFSGLAFAGVICALLLQQEELKTTHVALARQGFENTFFKLLSLHQEIVNSVQYSEKSGRQAFLTIWGRIVKEAKRQTIQNRDTPIDIAASIKIYEEIYYKTQHILGHYFRNLYRIIKFFDQSSIVDKKFYTDIVRAQISNQELMLLFYNCLSAHGIEKFKPLVEKYSLLNNLPPTELINPEKDMKLFRKEAYGTEYPENF
jgi:hypothetical protein